MGFWTRRGNRAFADNAEDLAYSPSGGRLKQWLAGVLVAAIPIGYGVFCLLRGKTTMFASRGGNALLVGREAWWLAVAYIAIGAFIHFHFFWGLNERLLPYSQAGKIISILVILPSLLWVFYRMLII